MKAMKRLEGNWNVTAMTLDVAGSSVDYWAEIQAYPQNVEVTPGL